MGDNFFKVSATTAEFAASTVKRAALVSKINGLVMLLPVKMRLRTRNIGFLATLVAEIEGFEPPITETTKHPCITNTMEMVEPRRRFGTTQGASRTKRSLQTARLPLHRNGCELRREYPC